MNPDYDADTVARRLPPPPVRKHSLSEHLWSAFSEVCVLCGISKAEFHNHPDGAPCEDHARRA